MGTETDAVTATPPAAAPAVPAPAAPADAASYAHATAAQSGLLHTDADLVATLTLDGRVLAASATVSSILGWDRRALLRNGILDCLAEDDRATVVSLGDQLRRDGSLRATVRLVAADGRALWLDVAGKVLERTGDGGYAYISARDVTDDVLATAHLAASEHQWRLAFEHSPTGGALLDLEGSFLITNNALAAMLGYRIEELTRLGLEHVTAPEDRAAASIQWLDIVEGRRTSYSADRRHVTSDGRTLWCHVTAAAVRGEDGSLDAVMVQLHDITERRDAELQLANRALHDGLTSLPNRFMTRQWLSSALEDHPGQVVGVLYCDLDRFKVVNDSLGHAAGDELLVQVSTRLRETLRDTVLVGRVGGDEFVLVVEGVTDPTDLIAVSSRVTAALDEPIALSGHLHTVTMSIGAALGTAPDSADEVLMRADMALLRAKRLGRARVEVFDDKVDRIATRDDLELEDHLRESVEAGELRTHYQPIVTLRDQRVVGYETLLRWQHPARGLLPPDRFLDLAESSGLIRPIGWWVLSQACHDAVRHPRLAPAGAWIAVNASASQLSRPGVAALVRKALDESGLRPQALHLEITEAALIQASGSLGDELREVSDMGVRIALDDFGTGYSSLSLLRDFPVDMVKIDRSFVQPLLVDRSALAIVRAVLSMCHDLGLPAVAEGVETRDQAERLAELGCSHGQGFYFGRPAPMQEG